MSSLQQQHLTCPKCRVIFERKVAARTGRNVLWFECPRGHGFIRNLARRLDRPVVTEIKVVRNRETEEEWIARLMREARHRIAERKRVNEERDQAMRLERLNGHASPDR